MRVRQHQRRDRLARGRGRHAHDAAEGALAHPGHDTLDHLDRRHNQLAVSGLPLIARELERIGSGGAAGVGHEDVDRTEVALDAVEQLGCRVEVERVVHVRLRADLGGGGLDLLARPRAHRHPGTLAGQLPGDAEADALRRTRNQRDPALEAKIHDPQSIRERV